MYAYPDAVIMVFCKAPISGQVKTRLTPPLTAEQAAQLHCELTEKTLQTATAQHLCAVQLWCAPTIDHSFFTLIEQAYGITRHLQQGDDLGERMHNAFHHALTDFTRAVIIGCDCPSLNHNDLELALHQLTNGKTCVIAPAEDGGYVLIGLNQPQPNLFNDMPWGTEQVLTETRSRLHKFNIDYHELNTHWDLDTPKDLARYRLEMCRQDEN